MIRIGANAPTRKAGAQLAYLDKKVKITAKYWPAIVPIGPNIENDKIPMLRNINIGTSTKRSDLGII